MTGPADNRNCLDRLRAAQYDWDEATLLAALEAGSCSRRGVSACISVR